MRRLCLRRLYRRRKCFRGLYTNIKEVVNRQVGVLFGRKRVRKGEVRHLSFRLCFNNLNLEANARWAYYSDANGSEKAPRFCLRHRRDGQVQITVKWFQGGLIIKAHRFLHHSTLGWRVMKKNKKIGPRS